MILINCNINLIPDLVFKLSANNATQAVIFAIINKSVYVPVVALRTKDKVKLLEQFKFYFKIRINWNKYQSKVAN